MPEDANGSAITDPVLDYCEDYAYWRRKDGVEISSRCDDIARNLLAALKVQYEKRSCRICDKPTPYPSAAYCAACQRVRPWCDCGKNRVGYDTTRGQWFEICFECETDRMRSELNA